MATRFWTFHWQNRFWRREVNREYAPIDHSAGNSFAKRGISPGDVVYVVSLKGGQILLGGRMIVDRILNYQEAVEFFGHENFYDAEEHLIGVNGSGTPLDLHRQLSPALAKQLRFESKTGPRGAFFTSDDGLDNQATRGVRELTRESASLLDRIIEATGRLPRTGQLITVTEEQVSGGGPGVDHAEFRSPEEVPSESTHTEGNVSRAVVNRYERDPRARLACISAQGSKCCICGFSFGAVYGAEAEGYIHVHHVRPLSDCDGEYVVDPMSDLRPVCPNCHAVLHMGGRCRSVDEVQELLVAQRRVP